MIQFFLKKLLICWILVVFLRICFLTTVKWNSELQKRTVDSFPGRYRCCGVALLKSDQKFFFLIFFWDLSARAISHTCACLEVHNLLLLLLLSCYKEEPSSGEPLNHRKNTDINQTTVHSQVHYVIDIFLKKKRSIFNLAPRG